MEHTNYMGWTGLTYKSVRTVYIAALETIIAQRNTSESLDIFYAPDVKKYFDATTKSLSKPPTIELIITSQTVASDCYVKVNIDWSAIDVATKNNLIRNAKKELAGMRRITSDAQQELRKVELDSKVVKSQISKQNDAVYILSAAIFVLAIVTLIILVRA